MPLTSTSDRYRTATTDPTRQPAPLSPWQTQPQQPGSLWGSPAPLSPPQQTAGAAPMQPASPGMMPPAQQPNALAPQGTRIAPSYLPENWDYHQSPEYQQRLAWAQRDLNRQLLSTGRSDSTGGINALARQQAEIAGQEIDKQYQRALAANMQNYGRYFGANVENYGRTRGEDETGWNRAAYLDNVGFRNQGRDFSQNYQLADMGLRATTTGVQSGNAAGASLAQLLSGNGANQAALALSRGDVDAGTIKRLMDSGFGFAEIEKLFAPRTQIPSAVNIPGSPSGSETATLPTGQTPDWMYQPNTIAPSGQYAGGYGGSGGYDFFA